MMRMRKERGRMTTRPLISSVSATPSAPCRWAASRTKHLPNRRKFLWRCIWTTKISWRLRWHVTVMTAKIALPQSSTANQLHSCPEARRSIRLKRFVHGYLVHNRNTSTQRKTRCLRNSASGVFCFFWVMLPSTICCDYCLTTIVRETLKAGLSSAFNGFATIQKRRTFSSKAGYSLKTQHFIRMRLKTPTVVMYSVVLLWSIPVVSNLSPRWHHL